MPRNKKVDQYINALPPDAKRLATELRALIFAVVPDAKEEFKWSRPCYELDKRFCSFVANKAHMNLAFDRGGELDDPKGLLEGTGKSMRHIKIPYGQEIPAGARALLKQAAKRST